MSQRTPGERCRTMITLGIVIAMQTVIALRAQAQSSDVWTWSAQHPRAGFQVNEKSDALVLSALNAKRPMDFTNTRLCDVARALSNEFGIPVVLDAAGLEEETVTPDEPITISVPPIRLKHFLKVVLAPLNLTYVVQHGTLVITNSKFLPHRMVLYDVTRITHPKKHTSDSGNFTPNRLGYIIETTIDVDQWANAGGTANLRTIESTSGNRYLFVVATDETQESIQDFLRTLAAEGTPPTMRTSGERSIRGSRLRSSIAP